MPRLICFILMLFLITRATAQGSNRSAESQATLTGEFHPTIATYCIVERLVAANQGWLFYMDGKESYDYIPLVAKAFKRYGTLDNSSIIQSMKDYLAVVGNTQDLTYQVLVRMGKFPDTTLKYPLDDVMVPAEHLVAFRTFLKALYRFYIERDLAAFFQENSQAINGGVNEFLSNVPEGYLGKMEAYFGQRFLRYVVYTMPFDAVPMDRQNEKDFFHGNAQTIHTPAGKMVTMVTSAFRPVDSASEKNHYGFDHPDYVKLIITHEFGHAFVNHLVDSMPKEVKVTEAIFLNSGMKEKMEQSAYTTWQVTLREYLVRVGEIRIAETNGENQRAADLRKKYITDMYFVLIPKLEKKFIEYEKNRSKYPEFENFMPEIFALLRQVRPEEVKALLN